LINLYVPREEPSRPIPFINLINQNFEVSLSLEEKVHFLHRLHHRLHQNSSP